MNDNDNDEENVNNFFEYLKNELEDDDGNRMLVRSYFNLIATRNEKFLQSSRDIIINNATKKQKVNKDKKIKKVEILLKNLENSDDINAYLKKVIKKM